MNNSSSVSANPFDAQRLASDPKTSAWLSANAGSGKTHVLTQRVIRLMLAGNAPDRILCLTFTKAAAANMKNRVFETLGEWVMMGDIKLDAAILEMTGRAASENTRTRARQLFARALDTPGGLKIQTIHAFCAGLLHQFPLEANIPSHFETLEGAEKIRLLEQARTEVLASSKPAADHYAALIDFASDDAIEKGLEAVIAMRQAFLQWMGPGLFEAMEPLYRQLGVELGDSVDDIKQRTISGLPVTKDQMRRVVEVATTGKGDADKNTVSAFAAVLDGASPELAFCLLRRAFLTGENKRRKTIVTKPVRNNYPEIDDILDQCVGHFLLGLDKIDARLLLLNSRHLFEIAYEVLERYAALKHARGVIDFDDQIEKSANLLNRAHIRAWIRYRLDRGVDHVLVDEAQDTSPAQWQVINAITDDFHSGKTSSGTARTMFVVGDEKQSIYSFQGARPEEFANQHADLKKRVSGAGDRFHSGMLNFSFRSTDDVLKAVDKVFGKPVNAASISQAGEATVHDTINRKNDPGEVQIWPLFEKPETEETSNWLDPLDRLDAGDPAVELANRITTSVKQWVGKPLPGMEIPLKFSDILVLVRSRDKFSAALVRAMKDAGLAVAGADRLKLVEHIAIEDLLAIGRFVLMPQDDLSLAAVLKSPFFNVSEKTLFQFANRRDNRNLYQQVEKIAADKDHPATAIARVVIDRLQQFVALARQLDVFEFYARLLGELGGLKAILARLGAEAEDVINAFLEETLSFGRTGNGGLEAFIAELTSTKLEIKREVDLERDELRIMTVHSAKGLEARVVFLVDACKAVWTGSYRPKIMAVEDADQNTAYLWMPEKTRHILRTLACEENLIREAEDEYHRLLYVGMTRAADRLIVCGYKGEKDVKSPNWHTMVSDALLEEAQEMSDDTGVITGWRWIYKHQPPRPVTAEEDKTDARTDETAIPSWLFERVKRERPLPRPLTPSDAFALIDRESTNNQGLRLSAISVENSTAIERGNFTHRLLEVLPNIARDEWLKASDNYLARVAATWENSEREALRDTVITILNHPVFAGLYNKGTRAEVTITGRLDTKDGPRLVTGQIDRLIVSRDEVIIVDYKTSRNVPQNPQEVDRQYLAQQSLYREMIGQIYPDHRISCAFLWTRLPELMIIPDGLLDEVLGEIRNG